ncbi:hypothetical protein CYMTET_28653 [Cymbomonas tetramitiformis]|uniref:F-box domain-containing protein n=1 Tax=Cymbomonas tetramitiformis TaxID=36881 RepID=A0AAE0FMP9_9CHLO|nr:hypothetical protein CYMTET_28653 [Cymbomonas tetramitiformis]
MSATVHTKPLSIPGRTLPSDDPAQSEIDDSLISIFSKSLRLGSPAKSSATSLKKLFSRLRYSGLPLDDLVIGWVNSSEVCQRRSGKSAWSLRLQEDFVQTPLPEFLENRPVGEELPYHRVRFIANAAGTRLWDSAGCRSPGTSSPGSFGASGGLSEHETTTELPAVVWSMVLRFCDTATVCAAGAVCTELRRAAQNPQLWADLHRAAFGMEPDAQHIKSTGRTDASRQFRQLQQRVVQSERKAQPWLHNRPAITHFKTDQEEHVPRAA